MLRGSQRLSCAARVGELKGFANVCRHRGSLVCLDSNGHTDKFVCPYHGWMYDIDGKLFAARNMPDDFDKAAHSLNPVSVDVIHGLIFVAFTDTPPSLEGAKRDLAEPMAMFDFENLKVAAQKSYEIPANWKLSIENYQECYHCATAHPEYARMHTLMLDSEKRERMQGKMKAKMEACGVKDLCINHIDTAARRRGNWLWLQPHGAVRQVQDRQQRRWPCRAAARRI